MSRLILPTLLTEELKERCKKLSKRENQFWECVAWGASQKEVAAFFKVSLHTVDNTVRHLKEKLGLSKAAELSACWFCVNFDISFSLSPMQRRHLATGLLFIFLGGEVFHFTNAAFTIRRRTIESSVCRARRQESAYELTLV